MTLWPKLLLSDGHKIARSFSGVLKYAHDKVARNFT